jgi:hypothetical protein
MKMNRYLATFINGKTVKVTGLNFREAILRAAVHGLDQAWGSEVIKVVNLETDATMDNISIAIE